MTIGRRRTDGAPVVLDRNAYTRHAAFLGGTGSGKTTAALNVIEQLLLGGTPAVLIDRKGDLASYAKPSVLATPCDTPSLEPRRRRLEESISVRLYTPGRSDGRPLSLSVVPDGAGELNHAELQNIARGAAESLGAMLNYGKLAQAQARISVIIKAVEILAQRGVQITVPVLFEYIAEPDEILITELGRLPSKHREKVVEDLQMLHINQQPLFAQEGDPLHGDALFGRGRWAEPGRTRLSTSQTVPWAQGAINVTLDGRTMSSERRRRRDFRYGSRAPFLPFTSRRAGSRSELSTRLRRRMRGCGCRRLASSRIAREVVVILEEARGTRVRGR